LTKKEIHSKIHFYLAIVVAFTLPLGQLTALFIGLMLLNWLVEGDFKNKFESVRKSRFSWLFISFYLLHLLGMLYTHNTDAGLFSLQVKLSLLFFPFILVSRPLDVEKATMSFIVGCIVSSLIMLSIATYSYFVRHENNFFYEGFSVLVHPGYLSMYLNVAIAMLLISNSKLNNIKWIKFILIAFFCGILILLSSKLNLLVLVLIFFSCLLYYMIINKKYIIGLSGLILITLSIVSVLKFVPQISGRIKNAVSALTSVNSDPSAAESTAVRLLIWKASNDIISESKLIGVGTGDVQDKLTEEYKKRGMTGALENNLNAHNEYYQVFIALGLVGFLLLILNLCLPLWYSYQTKNVIYLAFLLIIIMNFLPESMLEAQAGTMFYGFFNSLLLFGKSEQDLK